MSLSLVLNIVTDDSPMSKGNLFHNFGATKEYALSSYALKGATDKSSKCLFEDRNIKCFKNNSKAYRGLVQTTKNRCNMIILSRCSNAASC